MARPRKHNLTIEPIYEKDSAGVATDRLLYYRMFGYVNNVKIRRRSLVLSELENERTEHLKTLQQEQTKEKPHEVWTFATTDQVRMLEGMLREFPNLPRPWPEYFRAGVNVLGNGARVLLSDARTAFEKNMLSMLVQVSELARKDALRKVDHFIAFSKCRYLDDVAPEHIRQFLERNRVSKRSGEAIKTSTRMAHGAQLQAFLNFCVKAKYLRTSPYEIDMGKLAKIAKEERERAKILRPEQVQAMLDATIEICPEMTIHVILSTWCFMRHAEIKRLERADLLLDGKTPCVQLLGEKFGSQMRNVDIPPNILPLFLECLKAGHWPEPKKKDEKGGAPFWSRAYFNSIRERAGFIKLSKPTQKNGYRAVLSEEHWQEHIQRHTGISYHFNKFGDIMDTTRQAGNSPATAFAHYIRLPRLGDGDKFYAIVGTLKKNIAHEDAQSVA